LQIKFFKRREMIKLKAKCVEELKETCGVHCPYYRQIHVGLGVCVKTGLLKIRGSKCTERRQTS